MWRLNKPVMLIVAIALMEAGGQSARSQVVTRSGEPVTEQVGITAKLGEQVPLDLEFVDSTGQTIWLGECFDGRPVVLHLVYYECPMLCKLAADGLFDTLSTLSLELGEEFSIVTFSFDPRETPELSALAQEVAVARCGEEPVERGWRFLTGEEAAIRAACNAVGFRYMYDDDSQQFAHAAGVFVLTPDGKVSRYLSGVNYSPRDLRLAIVEASSGNVGAVTDQMLLLCYMYDPSTGKYGLAIMTAIRAGGVATVGILGASIFIMLRREKRNRLLTD